MNVSELDPHLQGMLAVAVTGFAWGLIELIRKGFKC